MIFKVVNKQPWRDDELCLSFRQDSSWLFISKSMARQILSKSKHLFMVEKPKRRSRGSNTWSTTTKSSRNQNKMQTINNDLINSCKKTCYSIGGRHDRSATYPIVPSEHPVSITSGLHEHYNCIPKGLFSDVAVQLIILKSKEYFEITRRSHSNAHILVFGLLISRKWSSCSRSLNLE